MMHIIVLKINSVQRAIEQELIFDPKHRLDKPL